MVDTLVTNFHQPNTTHLLLVAAFLGATSSKEAGELAISKIYKHALEGDYRFLSYGDSMIIL